MLDLLGIVFSGVMMIFVIFRAFQADSTNPWFQALPRKEEGEPAKSVRRLDPASEWRARR